MHGLFLSLSLLLLSSIPAVAQTTDSISKQDGNTSFFSDQQLRDIARKAILGSSKKTYTKPKSTSIKIHMFPRMDYGDASLAYTIDWDDLKFEVDFLGPPPKIDFVQDAREAGEHVELSLPQQIGNQFDLYRDDSELHRQRKKRQKEIENQRAARERRARRNPFEVVQVSSRHTSPWTKISDYSRIAVRNDNRGIVSVRSDAASQQLHIESFDSGIDQGLLVFDFRLKKLSDKSVNRLVAQCEQLWMELIKLLKDYSKSEKHKIVNRFAARANLISVTNLPVRIESGSNEKSSFSISMPDQVVNYLASYIETDELRKVSSKLKQNEDSFSADVQLRRFDSKMLVTKIDFKFQNQLLQTMDLSNSNSLKSQNKRIDLNAKAVQRILDKLR